MKRARKARSPGEARTLEQIPNIGPSIAGDLRKLGLRSPAALRGQDPLRLYERLNRITGQRHDPCLLDAFWAAVAFMEKKGTRPWWAYTARRKRLQSKGGKTWNS